MVRYIIFLIACLFFHYQATSQQGSTTGYGEKIYDDLFRSTVTDMGRVYGAPFQFRGKQWLITAGVGAGVVLGFTQDARVQASVSQAERQQFPDFLSTYIGEPFGNEYFAIWVPLGTYLTATALGADQLARPAAVVFRSTVIAASLTQLTKFMTHRQRPGEGAFADPGVWHGPGFENDHLSYFSGHTTSAFAIAAALSAYYKGRPWVGVLTYSLAAVTAWSRIYDNEHWLSDVVTAAVIGTFVGRTVALPDKYKWGASLDPHGNLGISFSVNF